MNSTPRSLTWPQQSARFRASIPWWKRCTDVICCVAALPILALATFAVAALTLLTSPGPIFFCQERVGFRGRRFKLYKFRTMHVRAETVSHQRHLAALIHSNAPMEKMDCCGDKRLVPGGAWVRASGLDELPQIINVLRGEMSIVGPRPCLPYEYEEYTPAQRERFACVPGLTGLWQVSGKNRTTFEQMVNLDLAYCRQPSPWLDLRIIVMTIPALCIQVSDTVKARRRTRTRRVSAEHRPRLILPL